MAVTAPSAVLTAVLISHATN
jgi:hypothetical protein